MFVSSLDAWLTPSHIHYDCLGEFESRHHHLTPRRP
jgi:hypothetical protein